MFSPPGYNLVSRGERIKSMANEQQFSTASLESLPDVM